MRKLNLLLTTIIGTTLLLSSCGGGGSLSENDYLGKLPSMANKYQTEIDGLKEKAKQATDMDDAFKYQKEYKLKKEEADKAIEEYMATAEFANPIPFENLPENKFEIEEITITGASRTRMNMEAKVKIKEDMKNEYGGNEKYFFGYFKAVDAEGNTLGKVGVFASKLSGGGPFTANMETTINGSLDKLSEMDNFNKLIFISRDEYNKLK